MALARRLPASASRRRDQSGEAGVVAALIAARCPRRGYLPLLFAAVALLLVLVPGKAAAVKREDFKTCSESSFCRRLRGSAPVERRPSTYSVVPGSVKFAPETSRLSATIRHDSAQKEADGLLALTLDVLGTGKTLRLRVDEQEGLHRRYAGAAEFVLSQDGLAAAPGVRLTSNNQEAMLAFPVDGEMFTATITYKPFELDVSVGGEPVVKVNNRGLFRFEQYRRKPEDGTSSESSTDRESAAPTKQPTTAEEVDENGAWEETFKGSTDTKPKGPSAVGLDFTFSGFHHVYGIPEHATSLALKTTRGPNASYPDPYRLYNLDVFEYELDNPMATYGSIPYMVSHKKGRTAGLLWLNAAETWIDVWRTSEHSQDTHTYWMSESGIVDAFILISPSPHDLSSQYAAITGFPELPPSFSIAYHQCRWNYLNERDVAEVDAGFDQHNIPYDVIWLDIEHTDGKRYLTWDKSKFPDPSKMLDDLDRKGRKMVTIIDPHIKRDDAYHVYSEAKSKGLFVKTSDGRDFDGWCWPGSSAWVDFTSLEAREWWAGKLAEYMPGKKNLHAWNDMNEPSVFSGPEITMPKDTKHVNDVEHRDIHNLYGMLFHQSTRDGLVNRSEPSRRAFVLSRAFFAGSQRYGAIWTGDNFARWDHLAAAAPMLLTIGVAGLPFAGADVGGFFGNPEPELLVRWYQAGAFQPFFRAHAHIDTKRREPWLFGEPYLSAIRDVIQIRYALLPVWYTLFWKASVTGVPVMRPMFAEFPGDEDLFSVDDQWMVGDILCVKPVVTKGQTSINLLLPGPEPWYDYFTHQPLHGPSTTVDAPLGTIPVFIRGGRIFPRRDRQRRASELMRLDPVTWVVALDSRGSAKGDLYMDDGETFAYQHGDSLHVEVTFSSGTFSSSPARQATAAFAKSIATVRVERLVVIGLNAMSGKARLKTKDGAERELEVDRKLDAVVVKDPGVWVGDKFKVLFS